MGKRHLTQDLKDYIYNGVKYKAYSAEVVKAMFLSWKKDLSFGEKLAIKMYRMNNCLKFNINSKLRNGKTPRKAKLISNAIRRAVLTENIIVYRRLAKQEDKDMQRHKENDMYWCKDFKGTHVETRIEESGERGISAGYMFILIPKNSYVAYINDVTWYSKKEKELLIDKSQRYQLLKKFNFFNRNGYLVRLINKGNNE